MRMPQNLEKKSPTCFDKTAVLLSSVKTSRRFFQTFGPFSEKLDFKADSFEEGHMNSQENLL